MNDLEKTKKQLVEELRAARIESEYFRNETIRSAALFPEQNPSPALRVARDGTLLYANPASSRVLELWDSQPGRTVPDHIQECVTQAFATEKATELEIVCGPVVFSFVVVPIMSEDYANLYGRDITEWKKTEKQLREQNRELEAARVEAENERHRLEAVMEALPVGVAITDAQGGVIQCKKAFDRVWRGPRPSPKSVSEYSQYKAWWLDTGKPVAPEEWASAVAVQKGESVVGQLVEIQQFDGNRAFVFNSAAPVRDAAGNVVGSAVAIQDITDLRKAEEELFASNQRLTALMSALPVGVSFSDDATCRRITGNPALLAQFEITPADNASASAPDLTAPGRQVRYFDNGRELADADLPLQRAVAENREMPPIELDIRLPSGRRWFASASGAPIHDQAGNVIGGVAVTIDITERKRAEEILRQRTADLEDSNKELEAYAYSISHDLRTPLRAIHSFSEILVEDYDHILNETGKDYLHRICAAAERMNSLMEAMLSLARLIKSEPERSEVNLTVMAREIADELRETQPERQVNFVIEENVVVLADSAMIRAVLDNLLRNAWKFTAKHDTARIEFGTERSGSETVYYVRDDGAGFSMAYADKLFKAFQRLHSPGEYQGTGIGLATVRRIIHQHGGRIWAEGKVEKGATFCFTLG